jgi:hypothetical protein
VRMRGRDRARVRCLAAWWRAGRPSGWRGDCSGRARTVSHRCRRRPDHGAVRDHGLRQAGGHPRARSIERRQSRHAAISRRDPGDRRRPMPADRRPAAGLDRSGWQHLEPSAGRSSASRVASARGDGGHGRRCDFDRPMDVTGKPGSDVAADEGAGHGTRWLGTASRPVAARRSGCSRCDFGGAVSGCSERPCSDVAGSSAPVLLARSTVCRSAPNAAIREAAMDAVWTDKRFRLGPDTDALIGVANRQDGCHLSGAGLDEAAALWAQAILAVGAAPSGQAASGSAPAVKSTR